jgi:hypothetical protein
MVDLDTAAHSVVHTLAPDWFAVGHSQGCQADRFSTRAAAASPRFPMRAAVAMAPASHLELLVPTVAAGGSPADYV